MSWSPNSALVRAYRSRSALAQSARAAVAAGGSIADLRRDAWGHGLLPVAHAVTAAGAGGVLVDSADERAALALEGVTAVLDETPDIDSALLYGLPGADGACATQPVLRLAGRVMSTKPLRAGEAVSYGYIFRATVDTRLALVTGGYAQGIVRALGNRTGVDIGGELHPVVGRVAMDVCVVDIGDADVVPGDEVGFFGGVGAVRDHLADWSAITGLSAAELVTVVGMRAQREWEA